jgi:hypothetical protein
MSFRKKGVTVTDELLQDILWDVKQKFYESSAPVYLKKKLDKISPVFHIVNRPHWQLYGQAWATSKWSKKDIAKRQLKLRQATHPTIILDGNVYFLVLQINKGSWRGITRRGLRYLVAHEFAHLLQIVVDEEVDGCYSFSTNEDHNYKWLKYTRWMGGTGSETIPVNEIWV